MKFITRQQIIDYYLDLINMGQKLTEEQREILTYMSQYEQASNNK